MKSILESFFYPEYNRAISKNSLKWFTRKSAGKVYVAFIFTDEWKAMRVTLGPPPRSQSLYQLRYPGSHSTDNAPKCETIFLHSLINIYHTERRFK
jgi:hypothetical protein